MNYRTMQTTRIISLAIIIMLFANLNLLSQEENKKSKSVIGVGGGRVATNSNYGENNFGLDIFLDITPMKVIVILFSL